MPKRRAIETVRRFLCDAPAGQRPPFSTVNRQAPLHSPRAFRRRKPGAVHGPHSSHPLRAQAVNADGPRMDARPLSCILPPKGRHVFSALASQSSAALLRKGGGHAGLLAIPCPICGQKIRVQGAERRFHAVGPASARRTSGAMDVRIESLFLSVIAGLVPAIHRHKP